MLRFKKTASFLEKVQWLAVQILLLICLIIAIIKIVRYEWHGVPDRNTSSLNRIGEA
jgi:hypothetical protein